MKTSVKKVDIGKPITANEHKRLAARIKKREERMRGRYREIHGRVVDWVDYYTIEDGSLYISIRFKDKTDFSLCFYPRIITDRVELCDSTTDDFDIIRLYEGKKLPA
ncbi:MAG: hypothetical protein ACM3JB_08900 [Acidobacteriaceae bacterium]